jgi:uncharacterized membrane protein
MAWQELVAYGFLGDKERKQALAAELSGVPIMIYVTGYIAALLTFLLLDMAWLGMMAPRFYRPTLGDIAISGVNLAPAMTFYALYPVGLLLFATVPALRTGSITTAVVYGALFGFFTYATYDLSNHATLRNWTLQLTLVDIAWGSLLAAITSAVTFLVVSKFVAAG